MKTIGFVSVSNPFEDKTAWSGSVYKLREAIENAGYRVIWIPVTNCSDTSIRRRLSRVLSTYTKFMLLDGVHSLCECRRMASTVSSELTGRCDALFYPGGGQMSLFVKFNGPTVYFSDATVSSMIDYYWHNVLTLSKIIARLLERKATCRASLNIRSSEWGIRETVKHCKCDPSKCVCIEFGANLDTQSLAPVASYSGGRLNVLFSGVTWGRKGGDIAVETVRILRTMGIDAYLLVVGINDMSFDKYPYVISYGKLDKNIDSDYRAYIRIWQDSHIFLLPTQAECAGIVFSEAAGFGIPVYSYDTGGVSSYVCDKVNGRCLSPSSTAADFALSIKDDIEQGNIRKYSVAARQLYKEKLSWPVWSMRFRQAVESVI